MIELLAGGHEGEGDLLAQLAQVGPQEGVGRDDLIEHFNILVDLEEGLEPLGITEMVDQGIVVVDQDQIVLAFFALVEEFAVVAQQFHKIAVALDGGVKLAQPADQVAWEFGVAGVECANLGVQ